MTLSPSCLQFTNWVAQTPGNNMEYLFTICTNGHKKTKNRWTSRNERKRSTSAWTSNTSNLKDELITRSNPKHPKHKTGTERNSSTTVTICNQHSLCSGSWTSNSVIRSTLGIGIKTSVIGLWYAACMGLYICGVLDTNKGDDALIAMWRIYVA